jgi:endonuclease YncB( thermonuclease family)
MSWLQRLVWAGLVVAACAAFAAFLIYAPPPDKAAEQQSQTNIAPAPSTAPQQAEQATTNTLASPPARDVGGGEVATVAPDTALERLPARVPEPKLEMFGPPAPPKASREKFLLFQPIVPKAGVIIAEGRTITLAGVKPIEAGKTCARGDGSTWPCGTAARTAMRQFIRGRAVRCELPKQQEQAVETRCAVGSLGSTEDIAEWLVEQGWAEAQPGSDLANLSAAAEATRRGIFGDGRR